MRTHPITGMTLEDGYGALPDDQQALVLHCAYLEQTQGQNVADAMRAKIMAHMAGEKAHKVEVEAEQALAEAEAPKNGKSKAN